LTDAGGRRFTLTQRAPGEVTAVFFGFTSCDDVCPTTIADLALARRLLPAATADKVRVVFVTVDPARDRPPVVAAWLRQFDPDFIGVTGSVAAVHQLERSLYLPESGHVTPPAGHQHAAPGKSSSHDGDYDMDHSGAVYLFGPHDQMLLHSGGTAPNQYAEDLTRLLQG
jgi:protein SCO1/2